MSERKSHRSTSTIFINRNKNQKKTVSGNRNQFNLNAVKRPIPIAVCHQEYHYLYHPIRFQSTPSGSSTASLIQKNLDRFQASSSSSKTLTEETQNRQEEVKNLVQSSTDPHHQSALGQDLLQQPDPNQVLADSTSLLISDSDDDDDENITQLLVSRSVGNRRTEALKSEDEVDELSEQDSDEDPVIDKQNGPDERLIVIPDHPPPLRPAKPIIDRSQEGHQQDSGSNLASTESYIDEPALRVKRARKSLQVASISSSSGQAVCQAGSDRPPSDRSETLSQPSSSPTLPDDHAGPDLILRCRLHHPCLHPFGLDKLSLGQAHSLLGQLDSGKFVLDRSF